MARKVKKLKEAAEEQALKLKEAAEEQAKRLKEMQDLVEQAEEEEKETLKAASKEIKEIADKYNLFCGVILTPDDLSSIVKLAIESKENIQIDFNLYFNDK